MGLRIFADLAVVSRFKAPPVAEAPALAVVEEAPPLPPPPAVVAPVDTLAALTPPSTVPPRPTRFLAGRETQEGRAARLIAARVADMPNLRAGHPGEWTVDPARVWSVRPRAEVLAELDAAHVPYTALGRSSPLVPVPVSVGGRLGAIDGVVFQRTHAPETPFVISAELACRLARIAPILRELGVAEVNVMSAYRSTPSTSFHTMGLGLDIASFVMTDGRTLSVLEDFGDAPELETIARALADSNQFSTVLTPRYNAGHRNHFHLDARPDDPRRYVL